MSPIRPTVTVVGRRLDPGDHRLRDFLTRSAQPFTWLEAGSAAAVEALETHEAADAELPVLIDGDQVVAPASVERLVEVWRINDELRREQYDLVIVGAGPAGLAAAVYAASDGLATLIPEADLPGGQLSHTSMVENFFGFPEGIGGAELTRLAGRQAEKFGAELLITRGVVGSSQEPDGLFVLEIAGGGSVQARTVVAAPGMDWRRLDAPGVEQLIGHGVYYGAGRSEAAQCGGEDVVVVGAGNSAGQAAMHLGNAGARVKMLVRGDDLGKSMSAYLVNRISEHPLIEVGLQTEIESLKEQAGHLSCVVIRDGRGALQELSATTLFLCLGGQPRTGWAEATGVQLDPAGYILTGPDLLHDGRRPESWDLDRDPLALETSVPGMFAAGDVRHGSTKRVGGAVGDGAMAAALVHRRLDEIEQIAG